MKLSVVMPAKDEEGCISETLHLFSSKLREHHVPFEIIVVDDGSRDRTAELVRECRHTYPEIRLIQNAGLHGFGRAVQKGVRGAIGDAIAVVMADGSDSPDDLLNYYRTLGEGYDCVFGSRFMPGGKVVDYPIHKLILNRLANRFVQFLFRIKLNDVTNAFKIYRRNAIEGMMPLISPHFNLTVEMPLKAIVRGYSYAIVPITWTNRKTGVSKLKLKEMGSRYLFIVLYLWLEKSLARGDYHRDTQHPSSEPSRSPADA